MCATYRSPLKNKLLLSFPLPVAWDMDAIPMASLSHVDMDSTLRHGETRQSYTFHMASLHSTPQHLWAVSRKKKKFLSWSNHYNFWYLCYSSIAYILHTIPPTVLLGRMSPPLWHAATELHLSGSTL